MSDLLPANGDLYSVGSVEKRWKAIFLYNYLQSKKSLELMEVGVDEPYIDWVVPFIRLYDSAIGGTLWLYSNHYDRFGLAYNTGLPNFDLISDLMMYVPAEDKFYFDRQLCLQSGFLVTGGLPDFGWNNSKSFSHENRNTDPNPPVDIGNHEGAIWFRNDLRLIKYLAYINYANPSEYEIRSLVSNPASEDLTFKDDIMLKVGKDSDGALPTASASHRGKMIRVEGGSGVVDKLYMCLKKADDSYEWVQVASG